MCVLEENQGWKQEAGMCLLPGELGESRGEAGDGY